MVLLVTKLVQMVKMVIPLVPMVKMIPTNGTIGKTPNTRYNVLHVQLKVVDKFTYTWETISSDQYPMEYELQKQVRHLKVQILGAK